MPTTNDDAALSYQFGEFSVLIWDNFNTNYKDALESLAKFAESEKPKTEQVPLVVTTLSMEGWETQDYTTEILRSAANLFGYGEHSPLEAAKCIQLCVNYLANICHESKAGMNESLRVIQKQLATLGYKETEVED